MTANCEKPYASFSSKILIALTVATSVCAAIAASPAPSASGSEPLVRAPTIKATSGADKKRLRPQVQERVIMLGRAYDAWDHELRARRDSARG